MSAVRTQIYLTKDQRQRIDAIAAGEGSTMAEVIRRAVDHFLDADSNDVGPALAATFGALPDIEAPDRDGWDRG